MIIQVGLSNLSKIKLGWKKVGEASIIIKWIKWMGVQVIKWIKWIIKWIMGVQAEFILISKTDLERFLFIFVLSNKTGTKTDLSGNIQRSWRKDSWVGYTWTWH